MSTHRTQIARHPRISVTTKQAALAFTQDRCRRLLARRPNNADARRLLETCSTYGPDELLAACMRMEHGDRGDDLRGARWRLVKVPIADVVVPNPQHLRAAEAEPDYYPDLDLRYPVGLLRLRLRKYFLLDGYHRLAHMRHLDPEMTAQYLVLCG